MVKPINENKMVDIRFYYSILLEFNFHKTGLKGKGIPITGHEGPWGMWMQGSPYSQPQH